jgi:hypothetical protein
MQRIFNGFFSPYFNDGALEKEIQITIIHVNSYVQRSFDTGFTVTSK